MPANAHAGLRPGLADRGVQVYSVTATLFFCLTGISYLLFGRSRLTYQDFWLVYDVALNHSWLYSTFLKYNGHSHIFPSQFWLINLRLFHGNENIMFFAGLALQLASAVLLLVPILFDRTIDRTLKVTAILALSLGIFWMGRSNITGSGGFNCENSFVLLGAAAAFICLPQLATPEANARLLALAICGGLVATFSFGTGLALWPTLFLMGYCLRLRPSRLIALAIAGVAAATVFVSLPAREAGAHQLPTPLGSSLLFSLFEVSRNFCELLGSPISFAVSAWARGITSDQLAILAGWAGVIGTVATLFAIGWGLLKRNLVGGLVQTGFALAIFNFIALGLIALGRTEHFRRMPDEISAPRYFYWSSLLWAGLALTALSITMNNRRWRLSVMVLILVLPVFLFYSHYYEGVRCRYAAVLGQAAAVSLIDGVHDNEAIQIVSQEPDSVYHLTRQLRRQRLDMFAGGLQDWVGQNASQLFPRSRKVGFSGDCHVEGLIKNAKASPAAKLRGSATSRRHGDPKVMVILDPSEVIRGIALADPTNPLINRLLYGGSFSRNTLWGYIPEYDPHMTYTLRRADDRFLSSENISISAAAKHYPVK